METAFSSVPWTPTPPLPEHSTDNPAVVGWEKRDVPYVPGGKNPLQTLTVWIPSAGSARPPPNLRLGSLPGKWLVFIHGGAWRDPLVTSASFERCAKGLLACNHQHTRISGESKIAGLVSINYRLSPHPNFPDAKPKEAYSVRHPAHLQDVQAGLRFLQELGAARRKDGYVLAGHSCGATLAFQALLQSGGASGATEEPTIVVGLNGIYDLVEMIKSPPEGFEGLAGAYEEFTKGAFGDDEGGWVKGCPALLLKGLGDAWETEGRGVVLVQSKGDTLVPRTQLEGMKRALEKERVEAREMEAEGEHDEFWEKGEGRMADILWEVVLGME